MDARGVRRFGLAPFQDWQAVHWKELGGLLAIVAGVALLWDTWLVWPLKILVVFFHEMSHGLAAIATGGRIQEIGIVAEEGGYCVTQGGSRFITLSAGYLGSLAVGGAILVLSARTRVDRAIAGVLGGILVLLSLVWVRPFAGFGFIFGVATGAALIAAGIWLPAAACDFVLKLIGLTSALYAVLDIKSDILDRPGERSDAYMLAEEIGLPTLFWGLLWIAIALAGAVYFLYLACRVRKPALARPARR